MTTKIRRIFNEFFTKIQKELHFFLWNHQSRNNRSSQNSYSYIAASENVSRETLRAKCKLPQAANRSARNVSRETFSAETDGAKPARYHQAKSTRFQNCLPHAVVINRKNTLFICHALQNVSDALSVSRETFSLFPKFLCWKR
ncbi:MAG: hypothetical protein FWG23_05510 [Eggerthellaceae bacterium]|jgi:glycerol-3-phosphate dehydrogenase|nr:hypothetical protein [Eggerthellaceae bacterium]